MDRGPVLLTLTETCQVTVSTLWTDFSLSFHLIALAMKIAITGCNGGVGRRVVLWVLKEGHTVVGADRVIAEDTDFYDNPAFTFHPVDLKDFDTTLKVFEGCDAIIQLAAFAQPMDYKTKVHNE